MERFKRLLPLLLGCFVCLLPVFADPITMLDGFEVSAGKVGLKSDKIQLRSSGGTGVMTVKYADSVSNNRTVTLPDPGADGGFVMTAGAQTVGGVKTFSSTPVLSTAAITANGDTITIQDLGNANIVQTEGTQAINGSKTFGTPLLRASINNSVVRKCQTGSVNGAGTIADGATYRVLFHPARAGTLTGVGISAITPPIGGTSTVKFLKNNTTAMTAADFDPTGLVANTISKPALHGTGANLDFTATDTIVAEWVAGTQTTDGVAAGVSIEYRCTDE